jgi:hypothetical protein
MKYTILGFNQEEVLKCKTTIDVNGKEKEVYIDVTDLLILQCVADFMNRQCVYKYMINDKMFFSIQYKALLEDLPILNIGKQALRDRIDKLVLFNLLEKEVIRNEQGSFVVFRIGTRYEQFVYNKKGVTVCSEVEEGIYQTTHGGISNYTPKDSSTINNNKEKEIDKSISKKDELFEQCWLNYRRKGSKKKSLEQWNRLSNEEKEQVNKHILAYVESVSDVKYQKDFERYLRDKCFLNVVYKNGKTIFDSETTTEPQKDDKLIVNGIIYR